MAGILGRSPATDEDVVAVTGEIAALEPPPLWSERSGLEAIARSIGRERLLRELEAPPARRLGAARLLLLVGERQWIRPVAALAADPIEEVRALAGTAAGLLDRPEVSGLDRLESRGEALVVAESAVEDELVAAVARALTDPSEAVRRQARTTMEMLPSPVVSDWVNRSLIHDDPETHLAAVVAEQLHVSDAATALVVRASRASIEERGPYLSALASLSIPPADLARMAVSVDLAHRASAVRLVWQAAGRPVLTFLLPMLEDPVGGVRTAVLESLAEADDPATAHEAARLLTSDSSAAVRASAVRALAQAPAETRAWALSSALADPDPDVRAIAVEILPRDAPGAMPMQLFDALLDDDERVWQASLRHLAALPDESLPVLWSAISTTPPEKRRALVEVLERMNGGRLVRLALRNARSPEPHERALAVEVAAHAGTEEATGIVLGALRDPDPGVRRAAASALSSLRTPGAVPALQRTLSDPQADVRVAAARALGLIDDDGVPAVLISALRDPEVRVRQMAGDALTRWRSPAVAKRLAAALSAPDLRRSAATVLERMDQAAVEPLTEAVVNGDPDARSAAAEVLERITGTRPFVDRLASTDPDDRYRATEVLGAMGGPEAAEALLGVLSDPEVRIRTRATTLLGAIGERRAIRPLKRMLLSDPVPEVAAAAEAALRRLGSVSNVAEDD